LDDAQTRLQHYREVIEHSEARFQGRSAARLSGRRRRPPRARSSA
jgi:hypothetical protein